MSDRDRSGDAPEPEDDSREESQLDTGETSGLGLTEEFARIEAEIEGEDGERGAEQAPPEPVDDDDRGEGTEEWASPADVPPDTAEEWITAEEATGEPGHYGETGEYDAVPDTGEWAEDGIEPRDDRDPETGEEDAVGYEASETPGPAEQSEKDRLPEAEAGEGSEDEGADEGPDDGEQASDEDAQDAAEASASEARTEIQRPEDEESPVPAAAAAAAAERTEVRPPPTDPGSLTPIPPARASGPPAYEDDEVEIKVPSLWLRFLSGSVLIVASVAASVAVAGLFFLSDVAAKLQPIPGIQEQLTEVESNDPQTILIIGSDRRAGDAPDAGARSDTTMLLRVDPDNKVLSLFSLPRDLKVNIPGYGIGKLNEAYTIGGEKKTLKTVHQFTDLDINHVVEINFNGFADAVNAIDCVYIDVDRDYFNDNSQALSEADTYSAIDINSGYQRLCGLKALQYVRYRHTDTDLVRAARQQDFLREARQKVEPRELIPGIGGTGNELIDIFTKYTRSDISDSSDVIGILKSFIAVRDSPVNEVHFEGDIGDATDTYVTSTSDQVNAAIDQFLNGAGSEGQRGGEDATKKKDKDKSDKKKKKKKKDKGDGLSDANVVPTDQLLDTVPGQFEKDAKKNNRRLGIPTFYPTVLVPGSNFSPDSRTYEYENEDDKKEKAYKTVVAYTTPSTLTEYYGFMGTTWDDPPILRNPSETREINGREFLLFYDGDRLRLVGWKEKGNSYWLNNTLTQSLGESEMLAIASTMEKVG